MHSNEVCSNAGEIRENPWSVRDRRGFNQSINHTQPQARMRFPLFVINTDFPRETDKNLLLLKIYVGGLFLFNKSLALEVMR